MPVRPFFAAAALIATLPAGAAQTNVRAEHETVVTATRNTQPLSETIAATTVITRDDIERLQVRSVRELLRRTPGASIANSGGDGKLTSLFLRGTESDHVLVLINGVEYRSATAGLAAFQDLSVDHIERIEIVRGPRSSLYGSQGIGGVIQIFTRDGENQEAQPYFSITGGRYDTYEGQLGVSGGSDRSNYNISISGIETDGFNACTGRAADPVTLAGGAGCFTNEPDDDGYSRLSGSLRAGFELDNGLDIDIHALRADGDNEFDGTFTNRSEIQQTVYGASAAYRPLQPWKLKVSVGRSHDESNDFLDDVFTSSFETERDNVSLQNDIALGEYHLVIAGLDYRREQVSSTVAFDETRRDNSGAFLQYIGEFGAHQIQLAGRGDDNEQFGGQATGSAAWGWEFKPGFTLSLSYGTAFKAPTFNDLYFPSFPGFAPSSNPDLEPEESESFEAGVKGFYGWGNWAVNAYQTEIDDLIALDANFTPQNISETRLRGVEAEFGLNLGRWAFNANANYLDAENRSDGANRGNELPRRPEYTAQFDLDREIAWFSLGASVLVAGPRFDDLANTRELDRYELIDLRGEARINNDWRVQARIANLLDEDYETVAFFNQPGRSLFITLRYQPQ